MSFLNGFVENAKRNGARGYQKIEFTQNMETELRLAAYEPKKVQSSFPFGNEEK
jgi:hypothetical protein